MIAQTPRATPDAEHCAPTSAEHGRVLRLVGGYCAGVCARCTRSRQPCKADVFRILGNSLTKRIQANPVKSTPCACLAARRPGQPAVALCRVWRWASDDRAHSARKHHAHGGGRAPRSVPAGNRLLSGVPSAAETAPRCCAQGGAAAVASGREVFIAAALCPSACSLALQCDSVRLRPVTSVHDAGATSQTLAG